MQTEGRRRASGAIAALMVMVTVAGIVGAVAIVSAAGWLGSFWPVAVMVLGIVVGEVLANQLATRVWGQPHRPVTTTRTPGQGRPVRR